MSQDDYTPPKVWSAEQVDSGKFTGVNRPTAGAQTQKDLPRGEHGLQLHSLATPNGQKAAIMLEELLEAGHSDAEYDAWLVNIMEGDQFTSGFVEINPNSKIPALLDLAGPEPVRVFESGAILIHLAEKFGAFLPSSGAGRAETLSWVMWQMGSAPFIGGGFGHFYKYAPVSIKYPIDRYAMETKRLFDVANNRLAESEFLGGADYSIADIATYPWLSYLWHGGYDGADTFLSLPEKEHVGRWIEAIDARPAVIRGRIVNTKDMPERHSPADFDAVEDRSLFSPTRKRTS
ncbi:glutathione-dependent disulfide-bond oxidoreductase [Paraurantiacibacter namhicola]|uniref:Disulfide-bond oxidoreductase YghU n=1 Tax=Paraurantiacibacter namhicola TaxID=645517 RepID=A0A1C7D7Z4_9SPHN|nr:glutathione-dependent disulfide-bond oxidoreductase [Paraurantiacibacter namhicola]ANU07578.1 Disulfide-bond oxidoreductase YghU [Paraurantiacibacter namhicola]